jgi:hypothetical protein
MTLKRIGREGKKERAKGAGHKEETRANPLSLIAVIVVGIMKGRVKSIVKEVEVVRILVEESIPEKRRDVLRE